MRTSILLLTLCFSLATCANRASVNCKDAWTPTSQSNSFPQGTGVNIHFTDPQSGEIKMIADAGFTFVRMDYKWELTEKQRGIYDFPAYDRLMKALDEHRIKALFILDYGNPLYTSDKAVRSEEARQAFARWAVAAAKHFGGRGIVWEVFNEPNNRIFWPPKPDADEYIALALAVGRAFRNEVPNEKLVGPATAGIDFSFLESCFKAGLLEYWSAVSIHPYRKDDPETAAEDFCRLRQLIQTYSKGKDVPIVSSEWGYSAAWRGVNEEAQAELLSRELLTNVANGIPMSIWYDWRNDGADASEAEHNFGLVRNEYHVETRTPFEEKYAYKAARVFHDMLDGFMFEKRLSTSADDFVLVFSRDGSRRFVGWTTSSSEHAINIPNITTGFTVTSCMGQTKTELVAGGTVEVKVSRCPIYLVPKS